MIRLRYIFLVNGTRRKTEWEAKMPDITLNKIIADATSLAPEDRRRLIEVLRETSPTAGSPESIEQVAAKHGKKPLDFAELRRGGSFFPEDESVDDLIDTVRQLRRDRSARSLD